jgi:uncharacterized UPF0160 family protein
MSTAGSEGVISQALSTDSLADGAILVLDRPCSWKAALAKVEQRQGTGPRTQFVVFRDRAADGYRVQAVPAAPGSFACRRLLRDDWRGRAGPELCNATGLSDARFVHHGGFIGGAGSKESAIMMAMLSLGK